MSKRPQRGACRGLILLAVLVMIALLTLLAAGFTFLARAEVESSRALVNEFVARQAAESGIQRAIVQLRGPRTELDQWYNNPNAFRGGLVEGEGGELSAPQSSLRQAADIRDFSTTGQSAEPAPDPAWRFNLVACDFAHPERVRYGLTDECSKLNINSATEEQLRRVFNAAIEANHTNSSDFEVNVDVLVESLLDWRSRGSAARPNGAKDDYYLTQRRPPYRCKSAPFDTVDELLLVRGFSARVLYGEDINRNGLLDGNENDGDATFPPDNADGILDRGLAPYLTVWSRDANTGSNGKPRIWINNPDGEALEEQLAAASDLPPALVDFLLAGNKVGHLLDLIPTPPEEAERSADEEDPFADLDKPSSSGPADSPSNTGRRGLRVPDAPREGAESGQPTDDQADQPRPPRPGRGGGGQPRTPRDPSDAASEDGPRERPPRRSDEPQDEQEEPGSPGGTPTAAPNKPINQRQVRPDSAGDDAGSRQPMNPRSGRRGGGGGSSQGSDADAQRRPGNEFDIGRPGQRRTEGGSGADSSTGTVGSGEPSGAPPPCTIEELAIILDRLTTEPVPFRSGGINVNTAPKPVLLGLTELSEQQVEDLLAVRETLSGAEKITPAWLVTQGVVTVTQFRSLLPKLAVSPSTFTVESVGYADHVDTIKRLCVVLEMRGPMAQILHYQDLTPLGVAYQPREEEVRGATNQGFE